MKRTIAVCLMFALAICTIPSSVDAALDPVPSQTSLADAGEMTLSNSWALKYSIYTDSETGVVSGDGYAEDPESVDSTGSAGRWLSYTLEDGYFMFLGSDDGDPFRVSIGPDDLIWSWSPEEGWNAEIQHPDDGPQKSLLGVAVAVAIAVAILAGDSGCSCGHSGGTDNHPGTNPPE